MVAKKIIKVAVIVIIIIIIAVIIVIIIITVVIVSCRSNYISYFPYFPFYEAMFFTLCLWILMPSFAFKEFGSLFQTIGAKYESASCP